MPSLQHPCGWLDIQYLAGAPGGGCGGGSGGGGGSGNGGGSGCILQGPFAFYCKGIFVCYFYDV
jgi:hypothetical protein